jgi:hypothetical protein
LRSRLDERRLQKWKQSYNQYTRIILPSTNSRLNLCSYKSI